MRRQVVGFLAAGIVAIASAACGAGADKASDPANDAGPPTSALGISPGSGAGGAAKPSVDTRFSGDGSAEYCRLARSYQQVSGQVGQGASADLRQLFQDAARDIVQAVQVAPAEIKPDVTVVADGFSALVAALSTVNYDFTRIPPDLIVRFQAQDFVTASTRVGAYARNVCGLG